MDVAAENAMWVKTFREQNGRAPRVLHIGNIANNAYLNAKFLNAKGFDCDVLCHDYRHIMACPEWEDAEFVVAGLDHLAPDWVAAKAAGFTRPRWFVQGPQNLCIDYLIAKRSGRARRAARLWLRLGHENGTRRPSKLSVGHTLSAGHVWISNWVRKSLRRLADFMGAVIRRPDALSLAREKIESVSGAHESLRHLLVMHLIAPVLLVGVRWVKLTGRPALAALEWTVGSSHSDMQRIERGMQRIEACVEKFQQTFPDRADQLTVGDCLPYLSSLEQWEKLFQHYDVIQAYATAVAYPLLAGNQSYVGFEHGTLREFTVADNATSRLTSLGYQSANHVLITNGDCLQYAKNIKVETYTAMIHPVDDARISAVVGDYEGVHRRYGVRYLFFCPLRHDWAIKGADKYIRALPALARHLNRDFRLIMTKWGSQIDDSMRLAEELGVADLIVWVDPLSRAQMVPLQKSVDVVFDQIALPHFGSTAPQAIATGTPVIMSYDPASTSWIIPEAAPILSAWTEEEIVSGVVTAVDPEWLADYKKRAADWYNRYHSASVVVEKLSHVYREIIESKTS